MGPGCVAPSSVFGFAKRAVVLDGSGALVLARPNTGYYHDGAVALNGPGLRKVSY